MLTPGCSYRYLPFQPPFLRRTLAISPHKSLRPRRHSPLASQSWGADWGEGGYIRLAKGAAHNPYGQCGVQIDNQYAVI